MSPPSDEGDLHIGDLRARQDAAVPPLPQMCEYQPLPILSQRVDRALCIENKTAPRLARLQQKMHFRIMAERLKVADTLHRGRDRLLVNDRRPAEHDLHAEPLHALILQDLPLDLAHELRGDLLLSLIVADKQLRLLLLENTQISICFKGILALRQKDLPREDRHQKTLAALILHAEALACISLRETADRAHDAGLRGLQRGELLSGIKADLCDLVLGHSVVRLIIGRCPVRSPGIAQHLADRQFPACNFHPGEPLPSVPRDLEHTRAEFFRVCSHRCKCIQPQQKLRHPGLTLLLFLCHAEGCSEEHRKDVTSGDQMAHVDIGKRLTLQKLIEQRFVTEGESFG